MIDAGARCAVFLYTMTFNACYLHAKTFPGKNCSLVWAQIRQNKRTTKEQDPKSNTTTMNTNTPHPALCPPTAPNLAPSDTVIKNHHHGDMKGTMFISIHPFFCAMIHFHPRHHCRHPRRSPCPILHLHEIALAYPSSCRWQCRSLAVSNSSDV